jgi:hypothetical protein
MEAYIMNDEFTRIKNLKKGRFEVNDERFGHEFYYQMEQIGMDGWSKFENDVFQIVPFDWDGLVDCNCYIEQEMDKLYSNSATDKELEIYENSHMHNIDCGSRRTNFYHKPTGVTIEWYKHINQFEYINKQITYKQWQNILQDCVKSVLKDKYEEPINSNENSIMINKIIDLGDYSITSSEFNNKFKRFIHKNDWKIIK